MEGKRATKSKEEKRGGTRTNNAAVHKEHAERIPDRKQQKNKERNIKGRERFGAFVLLPPVIIPRLSFTE